MQTKAKKYRLCLVLISYPFSQKALPQKTFLLWCTTTLYPKKRLFHTFYFIPRKASVKANF